MRRHERTTNGQTATAGSILTGIANLLVGIVYALLGLAWILLLTLGLAAAQSRGATHGLVTYLVVGTQAIAGLFWMGSGLSLLASAASLLGADATRARQRSLRALHRALTATLMPQCIFLIAALLALVAGDAGAILTGIVGGFLLQLVAQILGLVWPAIQCALVRLAIFPAEESPRPRRAMQGLPAFRPDFRPIRPM